MNRRERASAVVMGEDDNPLHARRFKKEKELPEEFNVDEAQARRERLRKAKRQNTLASIEKLRRIKRKIELRRMRRQDRLRKELEARKKAEADAKKRKEDEVRRKVEETTRRKVEKEARKRSKEEARRKAQEKARLKAEEQARREEDEEIIEEDEEIIEKEDIPVDEEEAIIVDEEAIIVDEEEAIIVDEEEAIIVDEEEEIIYEDEWLLGSDEELVVEEAHESFIIEEVDDSVIIEELDDSVIIEEYHESAVFEETLREDDDIIEETLREDDDVVEAHSVGTNTAEVDIVEVDIVEVDIVEVEIVEADIVEADIVEADMVKADIVEAEGSQQKAETQLRICSQTKEESGKLAEEAEAQRQAQVQQEEQRLEELAAARRLDEEEEVAKRQKIEVEEERRRQEEEFDKEMEDLRIAEEDELERLWEIEEAEIKARIAAEETEEEAQLQAELDGRGHEQMQRASALEDFLVTRPREAPRQAVPIKKLDEEENPPDREIGKISPSLQALINQASLELRSPPPKEHKRQYVPIATDAASVGRVTHLEEKVIEASGKQDGEEISMKKTDASYDAWGKNHSQRGRRRMPPNVLTRSDSRNVVDEAAALGRMKSLRAIVVTNFEEDRLAPQAARQEEIDDLQDEHYDGARVVRTEHLMDRHVKVHRQSKARDWLPDFEEDQYNSLDDVDVPTEEQPELKITENNLSRLEIMEELSQAVAEGYWGRHYRLERPGAKLKVTPGCFCRYCQSSNPYQTFAYQKRWASGKISDHHPDGDEPTPDADPEQYGYIARLYLPCEESDEEEDVVEVDLKDHPCDPLPITSQCSIDFSLDPVEETDDEDLASFASEEVSEAGSSRVDAEEPVGDLSNENSQDPVEETDYEDLDSFASEEVSEAGSLRVDAEEPVGDLSNENSQDPVEETDDEDLDSFASEGASEAGSSRVAAKEPEEHLSNAIGQEHCRNLDLDLRPPSTSNLSSKPTPEHSIDLDLQPPSPSNDVDELAKKPRRFRPIKWAKKMSKKVVKRREENKKLQQQRLQKKKRAEDRRKNRKKRTQQPGEELASTASNEAGELRNKSEEDTHSTSEEAVTKNREAEYGTQAEEGPNIVAGTEVDTTKETMDEGSENAEIIQKFVQDEATFSEAEAARPEEIVFHTAGAESLKLEDANVSENICHDRVEEEREQERAESIGPVRTERRNEGRNERDEPECVTDDSGNADEQTTSQEATNRVAHEKGEEGTDPDYIQLESEPDSEDKGDPIKVGLVAETAKKEEVYTKDSGQEACATDSGQPPKHWKPPSADYAAKKLPPASQQENSKEKAPLRSPESQSVIRKWPPSASEEKADIVVTDRFPGSQSAVTKWNSPRSVDDSMVQPGGPTEFQSALKKLKSSSPNGLQAKKDIESGKEEPAIPLAWKKWGATHSGETPANPTEKASNQSPAINQPPRQWPPTLSNENELRKPSSNVKQCAARPQTRKEADKEAEPDLLTCDDEIQMNPKETASSPLPKTKAQPPEWSPAPPDGNDTKNGTADPSSAAKKWTPPSQKRKEADKEPKPGPPTREAQPTHWSPAPLDGNDTKKGTADPSSAVKKWTPPSQRRKEIDKEPEPIPPTRKAQWAPTPPDGNDTTKGTTDPSPAAKKWTPPSQRRKEIDKEPESSLPTCEDESPVNPTGNASKRLPTLNTPPRQWPPTLPVKKQRKTEPSVTVQKWAPTSQARKQDVKLPEPGIREDETRVNPTGNASRRLRTLNTPPKQWTPTLPNEKETHAGSSATAQKWTAKLQTRTEVKIDQKSSEELVE